MELTLSDEDRMLREVVTDLARTTRPDQPPAIGTTADDSGPWKALADLGVLALASPSELGGQGGTWLQASLVVEALAEHTAAVPYLGCGVLVPALLSLAGVGSVVADIAAGRRIGLGLRSDLLAVAEVGSEAGCIGFDAGGADELVVVGALEPLRLALVDVTGRLESVDPTRCLVTADLDATPRFVGDPVDDGAFQRWQAAALALTAADLVGVMGGAVSTAVAHAASREQFGAPIGSNQALQHLLADQHVSHRAASWCARYAAWCADDASAEDALLSARTAKAYASERARTAAEATIQVFGGMGFVWESWAHVHLRRVLLGSASFGNAEAHYPLIAALRAAS